MAPTATTPTKMHRVMHCSCHLKILKRSQPFNAATYCTMHDTQFAYRAMLFATERCALRTRETNWILFPVFVCLCICPMRVRLRARGREPNACVIASRALEEGLVQLYTQALSVHICGCAMQARVCLSINPNISSDFDNVMHVVYTKPICIPRNTHAHTHRIGEAACLPAHHITQ